MTVAVRRLLTAISTCTRTAVRYAVTSDAHAVDAAPDMLICTWPMRRSGRLTLDSAGRESVIRRLRCTSAYVFFADWRSPDPASGVAER